MFISAENILHPLNSIVLLLPYIKARLQRKNKQFIDYFSCEFYQSRSFLNLPHCVFYIVPVKLNLGEVISLSDTVILGSKRRID